jgi:hypothetical protein
MPLPGLSEGSKEVVANAGNNAADVRDAGGYNGIGGGAVMKKIERALEEYIFVADGDKACINHCDIVRNIRAELDELKRNLRGIEFMPDVGGIYKCPACKGWGGQGHRPDCWLKRAIGGEVG